MSLTQIQIIQSLGDAMNWLEKELSWGAPLQELRHLNGRIGELYAALITNGKMAPGVNQKGYDVISKEGERISVKTTSVTKGAGFVSFNPRTLDEVDRIMIFKINTVINLHVCPQMSSNQNEVKHMIFKINEIEMEIEILFDGLKEEALQLMSDKQDSNGKRNISLSKFNRPVTDLSNLAILEQVFHHDFTVQELENGSIQVLEHDKLVAITKPILRSIAHDLKLNVFNGNGAEMNTRQMGSLIIKALSEEIV